MENARKIALCACVLMIVLVTLTVHSLRYQPFQASSSFQTTTKAQGAIALDKAPAPSIHKPSDVKPIVALAHSTEVLEIVASPVQNQFLVVTEHGQDTNGEPDIYGGSLYHVRMDGSQPVAREIISGNNVVSKPSAVWNSDGTAAYYDYDDGKCPPTGTSSCGIFKFDAQTEKVERLSADSTQGLAISPDGSLLAFWDYSAGDKLTVFDLKRNAIVRSWSGEVRGADDAIVSDIAFAPDGKSVFALTFGGKQNPLKQFVLETGAARIISSDVASLAAVKDGVYFLQWHPGIANSGRASSLMKIATSDSTVERVLDDFPYGVLRASGNLRWIISQGGSNGLAIYDTEKHALRVAGTECQTAAVMPDGKIVYALHGELIADGNSCGPTTPARK